MVGSLRLRVDRFSDRKAGHLNPPATQTILRDTMRGIKMKKIDISTPKFPNTFALVDDEDYEWLNKWKWSAMRCKKSRTLYAVRGTTNEFFYMHRSILGLTDKTKIDHRDGNGLNNQKNNIRTCTHKQNMRNSRARHGTSSGYKGVMWRKDTNKWTASITYNGQVIRLGCYTCLMKAVRAYDSKAKELFGEFARTNF